MNPPEPCPSSNRPWKNFPAQLKCAQLNVTSHEIFNSDVTTCDSQDRKKRNSGKRFQKSPKEFHDYLVSTKMSYPNTPK